MILEEEEVLREKTRKKDGSQEKQEGNEAKKRQDQSVMIRADARRPIPVSFTITSFYGCRTIFSFVRIKRKRIRERDTTENDDNGDDDDGDDDHSVVVFLV